MSADGKKGLFDWYFKSNLLIRILIGLILGAIVGIFAGESILWVNPLGSLFVNSLKMIVMPVIVASLVVGAASINPAELGRVGVKIIIFYMITSAFAVAIGLLMGNIFKPGAGLALGSAADAAGRVLNQPKFIDTLIAIIPKNPFGALASGAVLPTIFFAIIFGIGVSYLKASSDERLKKSGDTLFMVFDASAEVMYMVVRWVLEFAPI
ncbi:MAG: cation:dicarboxylase symporter family transporter, partial [Spirochaetales bacterium]|nr:cation:dicarboxylase symporter family transporter [Spirochaetales bacterium]